MLLVGLLPLGKADKELRSLSEADGTEGGIVKEDLVTSAQHKRALQRKRKAKSAGCQYWSVPTPMHSRL